MYKWLLKILVRESICVLSCFSHVPLSVTSWTVAHQAPLSMGFSRQEYWSGLPFLSPMHERKRESEVARLCLTLSDPMDCSPPGSSIHGILQARVLEWVAISFSNACMLSCFSRVQLCVTPWTVAHQAPLSMGFSRQEYWSVLPFPSPEDLPNSGIKPGSPALQADSLHLSHQGVSGGINMMLAF